MAGHYPNQFSGKVIAITGGGSGIGLATAHLLAARGAKLALADVSETNLTKAVEELKGQTEVTGTTVDVRNYASVEKWVNDTKEHFGRLDGAANLAGVIGKSIGTKGIADVDMEEWEFVMGVNLTGVAHCVKAELRVMGNGASIVNAASIAGLRGFENNASYTCSKHACLGLTRSAAKEVGKSNIRVNAICPGVIVTPMVHEAVRLREADKEVTNALLTEQEAALKRPGQPEEVAKLIAFLLSDESSFITGAGISIDGGWNC